MKLAVLALLAATAVLASPQKTVSAKRASSLTVLYTCSATGQIRSCNCTKFRFGGYGRELTLLKSIRAQRPNSVLVEGGDATDQMGFQSDLKADVAAQAMKALGYQAMVPGDVELRRKSSGGKDPFAACKAPVVCANYSARAGGKPEYPPYVVVKTKDGLRVGIIGALGESVGQALLSENAGCEVSDPQLVLAKLAKRVRAVSDFVILVYHAPLEEARKLASVKGVDLILATHRSERRISFPDESTNEVKVEVDMSKAGAMVVDAGTNSNWSLGRIDLELTGGLRIKGASHKLIYLDRRYEEDPAMVKVYDDYNEKVKQGVLTASAKFKAEAESLLLKRGLNLVDMRKRLHRSPFAGAESCKSCHAETYESWSKSRHARAMVTLEKTHQDFDPECVGCHATGTSVRNGFTNRKDTPELANVQCEACHGPAPAHVASPAKGYGKVDEQVCRSCHTDERSPDFDFEQAWGKVKH